jgi:site-specific DNA recombinase
MTATNHFVEALVACANALRFDPWDGLVRFNLGMAQDELGRFAVLLDSLSSRRAEKAAAFNDRLLALQREVAESNEKLKRLYRLVEEGLTDVDEVLKDRLNALKADRDRGKAALERAKETSAPRIQIDPALIDQFGRTMREHFSTGSVPFRKAYLQSLIDIIEVDDHQIRIKGSKDLLEKAVLASQNGQEWCSQTSTRWRATVDEDGHYSFAVPL